VNAKAGDGSTASVEENVISRGTVPYQGRKFNGSFWPQWTKSKLVSFTTNLDERMITGRVSQEKIRNPDLCSFVSSRACVVKEEQKSMIPTSQVRRLVRCTQQRIHFRFLEVRNRRSGRSLKRNVSELPAPLYVLGAVQGDKASQRADRRQPLVTGGHCAFAGFL
jgi:hypothetical protein